METITRSLPKPIVPQKGYEEPLKDYTPEQKEAIYLWRAIPDYRRNVLSHDVLKVINQRHNLKLSVWEVHGDTIVATDGKHSYYLLGSWLDCRFICRGLLKGRKGSKHRFLCNGQASTGTIQVEHYGEQLQITYPDLQSINNNVPFMRKQ